MRHNKNQSNNHPASRKSQQQTNGQGTSYSNSSPQDDGNFESDRQSSNSNYYSQSEGRYTELPEHELQSSTHNGYEPSRGKYTQYRDDNNYSSTSTRPNQDRSETFNSRASGSESQGNYSDYYRPSERTFDHGSRPQPRNFSRPSNPDLDSDSYKSERFGSEHSNGNSFSEQNQNVSQGKFAGRGPKGYKRNDERIKDDVYETLTRHPSIDANDIGCDVKDGEVTLKGTVSERSMKLMAEHAISHCHGVKDVNNQIKVQRDAPPTSPQENQNVKPTADKKGSKTW